MEVQELLELHNQLEELQKRKQHNFNTYVPDDQPERNQLGYHKSKKWCRLLTGGNRSGKSRSAAQDIAWHFTGSHPYVETPKNCRIWVLSSEYRTIFEGIWSHLKTTIPYWLIDKVGPKIAGWDIPTYIISKTGARIDFISAVGGEDTRKKVQAAEIDLIYIDEEIGGELWDELQMRLLTKGGRVSISATLIMSEDWIVELERQAEAQWDRESQTSRSEEVDLFRLNTKLNKYNDQAALQRILSRLSPEEQEVRIYGRSRKMTGLIYSEWDRQVHEIDPFPIPLDWTRVMVLDPGFRTIAGLWIAITPTNHAIAYREMYLHNSTLEEVVDWLRAAEGWTKNDEGIWIRQDCTEEIYLRLIDTAAFSTQQDGTVGVGVQLANDYDLYFCPADKDWRTGVESVRRWLLRDMQGIPQFRIFRTLEHFTWERNRYRISPNKTKRDKDDAPDRPLKKDDHLMDCWRYAANAQLQYRPSLSPEDQLKKEALHYNTNKGVEIKDHNHHIRILKERQKLRREAQRKLRR